MFLNGLEVCPCPKKKCRNHSNCDLCMEAHTKKKMEPYCIREKGRKNKGFNPFSRIFGNGTTKS